MKNAKYKRILIAIVITISIVMCTAISYIGISHLAVHVILPHIFGPVDVEPEERYVYFDDGSVLERKGGPTYEHTLFDNYALYRGDNSFEYRFINSTSEIAVEKHSGWCSNTHLTRQVISHTDILSKIGIPESLCYINTTVMTLFWTQTYFMNVKQTPYMNLSQ